MRALVFVLTIVVAALAVLGISQHAQLASIEEHLKLISDKQASAAKAEESAVRSIQAAATAALDDTGASLRQQLAQISTQLSDKAAAQLEQRLRDTQVALSTKQSQLTQTERALAGLPELVELDELGRVYGQQASSQGYQQSIEFPTAKGSIWFSGRDVTLAYVPSTKQLAHVRIGKKATSENAELIRAWLSQATDAKVRLGYQQVDRKSRPADYGEYTETEYRKGDMYFRTYFQYERVQGTYGRHSMQYTYYVETGSMSRRDRYNLEQYNRKLGS